MNVPSTRPGKSLLFTRSRRAAITFLFCILAPTFAPTSAAAPPSLDSRNSR
jgi:hypothetical protein